MRRRCLEVAERLKQLPPYLFIEIDRKKAQALSRGVDLVNMSIGDPDRPTPRPIIRAMQQAAADPVNHSYPLGIGMPDLRREIVRWFRGRFGVALDPDREVVVLIGSKEGIGHMPAAFVNPGDTVLIPDPGYPVYRAGTLFAGGVPHVLPLRSQDRFLADLVAVPARVLRRTKMMWLNYPNNPTGAAAPAGFIRDAVGFAARHGILLCHDAAYSEVYYGTRPPMSFLQVPGARGHVIEFHSLSKTFNMTGWRVGFAVGNPEAVAGLARIKENLDSGVFRAVQCAALQGLRMADRLGPGIRAVYARRRARFMDATRGLLSFPSFDATFYAWCPVPRGMSSAAMTALLLDRAGIVTVPGAGFGVHGEGYVRFSLTLPDRRLEEAVRRLRTVYASLR